MKQVFILAALSALVVAKPELYKEQEDFKYSRSSSDDGSKSGYYGAQRGNMGGNYERSHNMDFLAQNQMSGLVRQVEGELGDGANTRAGSVYTAANSKGTYGSGHFDLTNLAGRNFHEGTYYGNSQSSSSQSRSSSAHNSADYASSNSQSYRGSSDSSYRGYQREGQAQSLFDDLQSVDNLQGSRYHNYGSESRHSTGFQSQAEQDEYDHNNANSHSGYGSNIRTRLISATPVKIVLTPGGRVAIPVAAQTYDVAHGSSAFDQNARNSASAVVSDENQGYKPEPKHYQSSYSYHKKWEKHDTIPTSITVAIPTEGSIPINSELLEDGEAQSQYNTRGSQSGVKSSSSQSQHQSHYNTQHQSDSSSSASNAFSQAGYNSANHVASSDSNINAYAQRGYNMGSHSDLNSLVEDLNQKPKSYQSSYSYHKSWERQGDPYVIKPASSGYYDSQASQRLTSSTRNQGYKTYQSGSRYNQNQEDCDENSHIRIARSSYTNNQDMQQQVQNNDDADELVQQVQSTWQNLGDLSQQSQNIWEQQNLGQEPQSQLDNLEDFNQQSQGKFDNLKDFNQQSQSKLDNLEDFNQQSQSKLDNLANFNQQSQSKLDNLETFNQQSLNNWDTLNVGQRSQNKLDRFDGFSQQSLALDQSNVDQQSQNTWSKLDNLGDQSQNYWNQQHVGRQDQYKWDNVGQQSQHWNQQNSDQVWNQFEDITEQRQNSENQKIAQNSQGGHQNKETGDIQKEQQLELNKTDTEIYKKEYEDKRSYNVETPWGMFDSFEIKKRNQSKSEQNTGINEFHWNQIFNDGIENQQVNKFYANGDVTSMSVPEVDNRHDNKYFNSEQASSFDNSYNNENVRYSYSKEFAKPMIYNKWKLNPIYHNSHQVNEQKHTAELNISQENNHQNILHDSKMLSFWDKLNNIEKESSHVINAHSFPQLHKDSQNFKNETRQIDTFTSNLNEEISNSTYDSQTHKEPTNGIRSENQTKPQRENQSVLPKVYKDVMSDLNLQTESNKTEDLETPLDIGRGDIGTDDFYRPDKIPLKVLGLDDLYKNLQKNSQVAILDDSASSSTNKEPNHFISKDESNVTKIGNSLIHQVNETKSHNEFEHEHGDISQHGQQDVILQSTEHNFQNSRQDKLQDLHQYEMKQYLDSFQKENVRENFEQKLHNFGQEYGQDSVQNYENFEQQNLNNFEQTNINDFVAHHENSEQNLHNIEQDNIKDLEQQNANTEQQNLGTFEQHNIYDFGQQHENIEQIVQQNKNLEQNLHNFMQEKYLQQSKNFEQQNLHNFEQANTQDFVQQNENIEQQNSGNLEQENIRDFLQQNKNLRSHSLHNFELENTQDYVQQNENLEQQNSSKLEQQNVQDFLQQSNNLGPHRLHNSEQKNAQGFIEQNEKLEQQNLQKNVTDNLLVETPVEATTEKPGFWKSLGGKISNAKNKVVSWFKS